MKAALTAEEWRNSGRPYYWIDSECPCHAGCDVPDEYRHGMAATCLHKQEFGFTWEMLRALREYGHNDQDIAGAHLAEKALDNLEALLPLEARD